MRQISQLQTMHLIALTGWGTQAEQARSKKSGSDHHVTKPAELEAIDALLLQIAGALP